MRGTQSLNILPYGLQLDVHIASPWKTPGFTGSTLPATQDTDHAGFQADWQIAGDAVSGGWFSGPAPSPLCAPQRPTEAVFGVDLLEPVPPTSW